MRTHPGVLHVGERVPVKGSSRKCSMRNITVA
jgi:hypothetical protein